MAKQYTQGGAGAVVKTVAGETRMIQDPQASAEAERNDQAAQEHDTAATSKRIRRYNLAIPEDLYEELQGIARNRNTTVLEVLRRFIKLGLLADKLERTPDATLIIREGDREREIILL